MSLSSFNAEEGEVKLIDPIKCPRVLRFLAVKLPKPRFEEERKVTFNKTGKKEGEENSFKIKSIRKIRSEKNIQFDDSEEKRSPKVEKTLSRKHIQIEEEEIKGGKLERVVSKKNIKLPPIEGETRTLLPPMENKDEEKRSLKNIGSSRKLVYTSAKHIQLDKEN